MPLWPRESGKLPHRLWRLLFRGCTR